MLALAGSGTYRTLPLSLHATTQIELIQLFLDVRIMADPEEEGRLCRVRIES